MSSDGIGEDDEEFCDDCFAGMESSEHHEKCVAPEPCGHRCGCTSDDECPHDCDCQETT